MAYHNRNRLKTIEHIISVYNQVKHHDVPDSHIIRHIFPKHNIFMSYRRWMNIKNMKLSELNTHKQMEMFS